jgi:hypothetical protein
MLLIGPLRDQGAGLPDTPRIQKAPELSGKIPRLERLASLGLPYNHKVSLSIAAFAALPPLRRRKKAPPLKGQVSLAAVAVTTMAFMGKVGVAEAYLDLVRMVMVYEAGPVPHLRIVPACTGAAMILTWAFMVTVFRARVYTVRATGALVYRAGAQASGQPVSLEYLAGGM